MKLTSLVICATALLTGCGLSTRDAVILAEARWRAATELTAPLPILEERPGTFACGPVPNAAGCWNSMTGTLTLSDALGDETREQAAVHEWGHRLGAAHSRPGKGVLAPRLSEARKCITQADIDLVCSTGLCGKETPECR